MTAANLTERSLVEIGDDANLNEGCVLQAHSLEEGVFKSDYIRSATAARSGLGAFVHYGVTMGETSVLDADSFLMKGECPDAYTTWQGNPAKAIRRSVESLARPEATASAGALEEAA